MFEAELLDKNGDLKKKLTGKSVQGWEYLRTGGCGQADVLTSHKIGGEFDLSLAPGDELSLKIDNQIRYSGKLLKINRHFSTGSEGIDLTFYGYITELSEVIINETYNDMEISEIVKDILDNKIVGVKKITYSVSDIDVTDFAVSSVTFNHTVLEALSFLGDLAGNVEWGVDRNKKFYFRTKDPEVRRTYAIGREIYEYSEMEDHEAVKNTAYVYGTDPVTPLATLQSGGSATTFGNKEINIFESSISEQSDANRLGLVNVKRVENRVRQIQIKMRQSDYFVEQTHPLGGTAVILEPLQTPKKYGNNFKYGLNQRYGSLKSDQISAIKYNMVGGGFDIELILNQETPNSGDQQKQVETQIKDLQRR